MGLHVAADRPDIDRFVEDACTSIGRDVETLGVPHLLGVVLGGGYGRGEGGVKSGKLGVESGELRVKSELSNDLDFFAIAEGDAPEAEIVASIDAALKPISEKWTASLGVDVDFAVKTRWRLKHDEERIMVQELVRGYFDVAGEKGDRLFAGIEQRPAEALPWMEAARLLMNRGMGLLLAKCRIENVECKIGGASAVESRMSVEDRNFINRNINKCILGIGDARLVARHAYAWRVVDRAKALGDELYDAAVAWKFSPAEKPVCVWENARGAWLAAFDEVLSGSSCSRNSRSSRTLRSAVRWLVRRRTVGELRTFALDPVVRILESVARHVRERHAPGAELVRDWEIFN